MKKTLISEISELCLMTKDGLVSIWEEVVKQWWDKKSPLEKVIFLLKLSILLAVWTVVFEYAFSFVLIRTEGFQLFPQSCRNICEISYEGVRIPIHHLAPYLMFIGLMIFTPYRWASIVSIIACFCIITVLGGPMQESATLGDRAIIEKLGPFILNSQSWSVVMTCMVIEEAEEYARLFTLSLDEFWNSPVPFIDMIINAETRNVACHSVRILGREIIVPWLRRYRQEINKERINRGLSPLEESKIFPKEGTEKSYLNHFSQEPIKKIEEMELDENEEFLSASEDRFTLSDVVETVSEIDDNL